jgi:hypothetical protein
MDSLFSVENEVKPKATWFKFAKIGDRAAGKVVNMFDIAERPGFKAQKGFELLQDDGSTINVAVRATRYNIDATEAVEVGGLLGIEYTKSVPVGQPQDAKNFKFYVLPRI